MRHLVELSVINNAVSLKKIVFISFSTFKIPNLTIREIPRPTVYPVVKKHLEVLRFFFFFKFSNSLDNSLLAEVSHDEATLDPFPPLRKCLLK